VRPADRGMAPADPMLGRILAGRFKILSGIGAGSMGTVYRAVQAPIGRPVAIKILRSDRAIDEATRARFLREARATSALTSPHTVTVFDFGQSETGDFYLVMELLEGESLGERIRRLGRLSPAAALDTARQALLSLSEAHAKGIIHRDLKPDNLFFARVHASTQGAEIVKVLDFGIAKMIDGDGAHSMNAVETQAGTVFGTPRYMSPEQAQGKPLDARSDLYSLGVMLYHMMTGRPPFIDDDAIVVMARHIKTAPPPMSEVAPDAIIPEDVERTVIRALSKEPSRRPQSADAMLAGLVTVLENAPAWPGAVRLSPAPPAWPGAAPLPGGPTDTLDSPALDPSIPSTRGRTVALGLGTLACAVVALAAFALPRSRATTEQPSAASVTPSSPSPAPASSTANPMSAPSTQIPTLAAEAIPTAADVTAATPPRVNPRPAPPRHNSAAAASAAAAPKSTEKPRVGYGYLE